MYGLVSGQVASCVKLLNCRCAAGECTYWRAEPWALVLTSAAEGAQMPTAKEGHGKL